MYDPLTIIILFIFYTGCLVLAALRVEQKAVLGKSLAGNPVVYSLSLAVYCSSWAYYGSVGKASASGMLFLAIYIGPAVAVILWWKVLRKLVRIKTRHRITSIADFISARYDKSSVLAALATIIALVGTLPYIAIQFKTIISTFSIITNQTSHSVFNLGQHADIIILGLLVISTILFGVRRLDPTERHEGMIIALAIQCLVTLIIFLSVGIFVTYFVYDGFFDIFKQLSESQFKRLAGIGTAHSSPYIVWTTYLILAMSGVIFFPRQFHVAVVENSDEKHILTAMWLFPLYLFLMGIFVFPIAMGGLLKGYPLWKADNFAVLIPIYQGKPLLALLVFIGGFSAAAGMIVISSVTLSTMITNHLLLPLVGCIRRLSFLEKELLKCKWGVVAFVLLLSYWFEQRLSGPNIPVSMEMISFTAVLQFAPAILGGIFWPGGNKAGAFLGLGVGFLIWLYILFIPALFIICGWSSADMLESGYRELTFLKPGRFFLLPGFDPLSNAVFWTMLFNISFYVLGSLFFKQDKETQSHAKSFVKDLTFDSSAFARSIKQEAYIDLAEKRKQIGNLLFRYFPRNEVSAMMDKCFQRLGLDGKIKISIATLIELLGEVEKSLAGSIGAASAHKAMAWDTIFTPAETKNLMEAYRDFLADFTATPDEFKAKIDFYQEREALMISHAEELKLLNQALELRIAEQAETEKALAESEKKYRTIFENAPEGIFQVTPDGTFSSASPSMARILGYDSPEDLIKNVVDIGNQLHVDPDRRKELLDQLQKKDTVTDFESRLYRKDRSIIWVSTYARTIRDSSGRIIYLEGFVQDISKRKEALEALQKSYNEMEREVERRTAELKRINTELKLANAASKAATRAKSEFLANMSHEIRTPMNGVIAAAELALSEKVDPKIEHYLKIINSSAHSLLGIINDILDFSKIEAGKLDLEKGPFSLEDVIDRVTDMFINKTAEKGIELIVDIDPETPDALVGDPFRLQQIIKNLIDNSIKFTEKGGFILLGVKSLERKESQGIILSFFVQDTGIGIAPESLCLLFKPFSQADASTTRKFGGTGLGLSICKQLVEMMDGSIWVESKPEEGSTFSFTAHFDLQPAAQKQNFVLPADIRDLSALVVDDCTMSREITQKILNSFGFRSESVSSGAESLKRLKESHDQKNPFSLVIMDWLMPDMDGIETSRRIREELKQTVPIILITAFGRENELLKAKELGIKGFLTKPIYRPMLFNTILNVFGKEIAKAADIKNHLGVSTSVYRDRLKGTRILVAEDNPTNQEIALAILEKAGIAAEIAKNGKEAIEAVRANRFDAVLMDIQMPEIDGYEATKIIRSDKRFVSLPIIAMTAHAMKGDEESCLNAGMDGYISKPINQERLFQTILKFISSEERPLDTEKPETVVSPVKYKTEKSAAGAVDTGDLPAALPGINIYETLSALDIENSAFKRILAGFIKNNKDTIRDIRRAFDKKDWKSFQQIAHSLKGSAGNIGAYRLSKAAQNLEASIKEKRDISSFPELLDETEDALNQVFQSIQSVVHVPETDSLRKEEGSADIKQLAAVLKQLSSALENADPEEVKKNMEAVGRYLEHSDIQALESHVNNYDYDKALKILKEIEKSKIADPH